MNLIKNIRIDLLLIILVISIYFLVKPLISSQTSGVTVVSLDKESECSDVMLGSTVSQISGYLIKSVNDFQIATKDIKAGRYVSMVVDGGPSGCVAIKDGYIGISVENIHKKQLNFGIDIQGGVIAKLKPSEILAITELQKIIDTIRKRIEVMKLPETKVYTSNGSVNIAGLKDESLKVIENCMFEGSIEQDIKIENQAASIKINQSEYTIEFLDSGLNANGTFVSLNESFYLNGIKFWIANKTNESAIISGVVFDNNDIKEVLSQSISLSYESDYKRYLLTIPIRITDRAAEKFRNIAKGVPAVFSGKELILNGMLVYSLDGKEISKLSIPKNLVDQHLTTISVVGFGRSSTETQNLKQHLEACLTSGVLLTDLERVGVEQYKPLYGNLLQYSVLFLVFVVLAPAIFFLIKKERKIGMLISILVASELIVVLGIFAWSQQAFTYGWIIDTVTLISILLYSLVSSIKLILSHFYGQRRVSISKLMLYTDAFTIFLCFILLFTTFRGFSLVFLLGSLISFFLTKPLYTMFSMESKL